jgi:metal-responsive CopG/Arc/MetJ family transcriptional regulator
MAKVRISISIDKNLFEVIEIKRELVSRSKFIEVMLKKGIENGRTKNTKNS